MNGSRILPHFLYITLFLCGGVQVTGVVSDSNGEEEATLDSQPTEFLPSNTSDNAKAEANINPGEDNLVPDTPPHADVLDIDNVNVLEHVSEDAFSQVGSEDANVNELINNDTPVVISRIDSATEELQKRAHILSPLPSEETLNATNASLDESEDARSETDTIVETEKEIIPKNVTVTDKTPEDIPSFSEWAQKHLEEAERKEQVNFSAPAPASNHTKQGVGAKLHWKNYAAVECGAKVIQANPEAEHTWAVLVGSRDEYILNPCTSRIWFIVELCEAIQLKKLDLANYELFSSSPKDFTVSVSDRFPTRDWFVVGQFTANDERGVQNFEVNTETFGKYVKVEVKTHYGSEHYCPLSLFRAYGMSVFEVLQNDDPAHEQPLEDEDDDLLDDGVKIPSGNLLSSATDAVLSMVKKAAQVLGNKVNRTNETSQTSNEAKAQSPLMKSCSSPSHYVVCNNCSDVLFGRVFELLSCRREYMRNLVNIPYIKAALEASTVCQSFGFDFRDKAATVSENSASLCVESFFPPSFMGAMCNILAIAHDKISYNVSHQSATAKNSTSEGSPSSGSEPDGAQVVEPVINDTNSEQEDSQGTDPLNFDASAINSKSGCSTETTSASQINPSKVLLKQLPSHSEVGTAAANVEPSVSEENLDVKAEDGLRAQPIGADASAEVVENESVDHIESVEKLITELNTESSSPSVTSTPTTAGNLQGHKESVFLRLSNRIKVLERNMSLSAQYLEELSKRYKKQIEEMQRALDKTERDLVESTAAERERYKRLDDKFEALMNTVEALKDEENNWKSIAFFLVFFICCTFLACFFNRVASPKPATDPSGTAAEIQRSHSVDVVTRVAAKKKKRRPSDQALKIVAGPGEQERKKRKKKTSNPETSKMDTTENSFDPLCASSKIWTKPNTDWVESRGQIIEDIPFPLEEPDSCTLKVSPLLSEPPTVIEAPGFLKTAANFRLGRASLKSGNLINLEVKNRNPSPVPSANGSISSGATEPSAKKEKKGFRKLLKKVF
ncbi:SUN domain-containing ossification factor [Dendroctonus ponderosae]|uniref:SUN domain-containing ossification factor n=1 Tax=Dendroctonus ponderosae TaxID=77166 RepID=UPI00203529ED|nr:SUN domain-containing ossification factor [Dendroctonus ponderosae]KAH1024846.1 hypothetical protein HUJ05_004275 [Dendroctonus ponderosae]